MAHRAGQGAKTLLAAPTAGGTCRSSAWASPKATSTAPAIPNTPSPRWATTKLQKLDPDDGRRGEVPVYRDIAGEVGATAHIPYAGGDKRPSTGWHAEFADFNNDGLLDIFVSKGNVEQMPDFAANRSEQSAARPMERQVRRKRRRIGHRARRQRARRAHRRLQPRRDARHPVDQPRLERHALPQPRRQDATATVRRCRWATGAKSGSSEPQPQPQRGRGQDLDQDGNLRAQTRYVDVGGGDASGHAGWIHVGLGTAERAEIRVQWPDGDWSPTYRVFANQFVVVDRTKPQAAYWYPGR